MNKESLKSYLIANGIKCSDEQLAGLLDLMKTTLETNEKFNLTAITDESEFLEKMIYDSALGLQKFDFNGKKVIDVGTGAGFPGMVLYILNPGMHLTLLDSTAKKINHLNEYCSLKNYKVEGVAARIEDYAKKNIETYDFAFARAVASLNILVELISPLLKVGGVFIALKGKGADEEIKEASNALRKLNLEIIDTVNETLPESNEQRTLIYIRKNKPTPRKYPREYSLIKKLPL